MIFNVGEYQTPLNSVLNALVVSFQSELGLMLILSLITTLTDFPTPPKTCNNFNGQHCHTDG